MPDEQKPSAPSTSPSRSAKSPDVNKKSTPILSPDAISRQESKATQFVRSFLRWAGVALLVFGLGALTTVFLFYIPKSNELKQAEQDLATANATINDLHTEITDLENQIKELSTLDETNLALQGELKQTQVHIYLLNVLKDIRTTQYALEQNDTLKANAELKNTPATLSDLQGLLDGEQAASINTLLSRLELALGELDSDPFAAQSDLEVLATSLLQLEKTLFSKP